MDCAVVARISVTSAPAENTVSPPVTTTARLDVTSGLRSARSNSVSMCADRALHLCSRCSVTTDTASSRRTVTLPAFPADIPLPPAGRSVEGQQVVQTTLVGLVGDDQALDLRGALPDPVDPQLTPQPLDRIVADVAAAAEDLHGPVGDPVRGLRSGQLDRS